MTKKQQFIGVCLVLMMSLLFCMSAAQAIDVTGKTFYTTANIWYENPQKIYSTNYHRGAIIPAGSKVTKIKVSGNKIQFVVENSSSFKIIYLKKYSSRHMNIWDYFKQYFSESNPMRKDGPYEKFTQDEKEFITMGEIMKGMSKDSVLMSYGYPPGHQTHSLKSNIWIYWVSRFVKRSVYFKGDKVFRIDKGF